MVVVVHGIAPTIHPFGSNQAHKPITQNWAQNALKDPMLLGAFLFHSAVHLDSIYRRPWSPITLYYRGESIRMLNRRLACHSGKGMSDAVIATIGFLGSAGVCSCWAHRFYFLSDEVCSFSWQNITGDASHDAMHRKAMRRIVAMRGGLQSLGWDNPLAMLISM